MKRSLIAFALCLSFLCARAAVSIVDGAQYSISCAYASGFVALGAYQGVSYNLYYQTSSATPTSDGYWTIEASGNGYSIKNALTGKYLSWTSTNTDTQKYIEFVDEVTSDLQRWAFTSSGSYVVITNLSQTDHCWDLRKATNCIGTYSRTSDFQSNNLFTFTQMTTEVEQEEEEEEEPSPTALPHSDEVIALLLRSSQYYILPHDYVTAFTLGDEVFSATLADGQEFRLDSVYALYDELPDGLPTFKTFKFNNKFNPQLFADVICEDATGGSLSLEVGCIGKWLTASFTFADDMTKAWVGGARQRSKKSRLSFAEPVVYALTNPKFKTVKLYEQADGTIARDTANWDHEVTVAVSFLTDSPTSTYGVPRIDITFGTGNTWSTSNWIGMNGKTYYEEATITIDGAGVFPDLEETDLQIKGRGNTSWTSSYKAKNPYHLRFFEKQKPLGMKAGKHWVLLANNQTGSMTTNALGHKIGNIMDAEATNHVVPVELYINGSYRGSYNLTEKLGLHNNSIDLDDDSNAALIELDTYTDETIYYSSSYTLPCKVKDPDLDEDETSLTSTLIMADLNKMLSAVSKGGDAMLPYVDTTSVVTYLSTNQLMDNIELTHPKSCFLYSEDVTDALTNGADPTPWTFGPVWDCDWAFGYQGHYAYFVYEAESDYFTRIQTSSSKTTYKFWQALRNNSTTVDQMFYEHWYRFVNEGGLDELLDYCDEYYAFASASFDHNKQNATSSTDATDYATTTSNSKTWLKARANYILNNLTAYDIAAVAYDDEDDYYTPVWIVDEEDDADEPDEEEDEEEDEEAEPEPDPDDDPINDPDDDPVEEPIEPEVVDAIRRLGAVRDGVLYDLQGRPVTGKAEHGIYIWNGRKIIK